MEPAEAELWARIRSKDGDRAALDELVRRYMPWVTTIARSVHRRVWAYPVDGDDFVQNATIGLLEAMARFDPGLGVPFQAYARTRVRGAVFNGLRAILGDRNSVGDRGRFTERSDLLHEAGCGDAFQDVVDSIVGLGLGYMLDEVVRAGDQCMEGGLAYAQAYEARSQLARAVDRLPSRLKEIIQAHYFRFVPFCQIAADWGLTKGRVSQLHKTALDRLRDALRELY